jgi:hypothetical protein
MAHAVFQQSLNDNIILLPAFQERCRAEEGLSRLDSKAFSCKLDVGMLFRRNLTEPAFEEQLGLRPGYFLL